MNALRFTRINQKINEKDRIGHTDNRNRWNSDEKKTRRRQRYPVFPNEKKMRRDGKRGEKRSNSFTD